ncbi:hypothetical protein [Methylomonas koyamae]|uniref:hypothetical protein n=1 Tax=Methylomonas koyamae TaxID=702114 RepID=UPI00112BDC50|nr:hypothetical protein [Methylomonas koyamae]TPQ25413.1 hypothetical protein C2U68_14970 [Methylomonas koyamae]
MLLESYDSQGLLTITSVLGKTSTAGVSAWRGDLVLVEGAMREGATNLNDRNPPKLLIHQAAMLADNEKILFVNGVVYKLDSLQVFVEKYKAGLTPETLALVYVENIGSNLEVEIGGVKFKLVPYSEGMVWNETMELLYIEKADLKGQSAEDKVVTVYEAAKDFKFKAEAVDYQTALSKTIEVKREASYGPV